MNYSGDFLQLYAVADQIGVDRRRRLKRAADIVAEQMREDVITLGNTAIDETSAAALLVLGGLPAQAWGHTLFWRHTLVRCALRLAADIWRWAAPIPRCTAEALVLVFILHRAAAADPRTGVAATTPWAEDWADLAAALFVDHIIATFYDPTTPTTPAEPLAVDAWFTEHPTAIPMPLRP